MLNHVAQPLRELWQSVLLSYECVTDKTCLFFQALEQGLSENDNRLNKVNQLGEDIVTQSSEADTEALKEKVQTLNNRWNVVFGEIIERKKR